MNILPIRAERVSKRFRSTVALDGVSLDVREGEIFGLLGPNGAGKTTLIRTILDIIKPDSGRIEIFGRAFQAADRDRVGYLPEERGLYPRQPVRAVLEYLAMLKGLHAQAARQETARWLDRFELAGEAGKKVEELSKGNQQKIQIAAALVARWEFTTSGSPAPGSLRSTSPARSSSTSPGLRWHLRPPRSSSGPPRSCTGSAPRYPK